MTMLDLAACLPEQLAYAEKLDAKREADGLKRDKSDAETKVGRAEEAVAALKQGFGALELRCGEAELERDTAKDATAHGTCL